jgi:hypothetical protein
MPVIEYVFDRGDNRSQGREIPIMSSHAASQLPNPFDRIEFRAVGPKSVTAYFPLP